MNCVVWEERVALYAGGDLPAAEAVAVEQHVADCAECQGLMSGLRQSLQLLREGHAEPIEQPHFAAVRARVISQLESESRPWWRYGWAFALTAAAMALFLWFRPQPIEQLALTPLPAPSAPAVAKVPPAPIPVRRPGIKRPVHTVAAKPETPAEPVKVKLLTDDPNVIIYWITDTKGE